MFNQALARDGYRCMITGIIDGNSFRHCADLRAIHERDGHVAVAIETAYILNESTMQGIDPAGTSKDSVEVKKVRFHQ